MSRLQAAQNATDAAATMNRSRMLTLALGFLALAPAIKAGPSGRPQPPRAPVGIHAEVILDEYKAVQLKKNPSMTTTGPGILLRRSLPASAQQQRGFGHLAWGDLEKARTPCSDWLHGSQPGAGSKPACHGFKRFAGRRRLRLELDGQSVPPGFGVQRCARWKSRLSSENGPARGYSGFQLAQMAGGSASELQLPV